MKKSYGKNGITIHIIFLRSSAFGENYKSEISLEKVKWTAISKPVEKSIYDKKNWIKL